MTAYFDELRAEVAAIDAADTKAWLARLGDIERRVVGEVRLVTGDREFPDDLRELILGAIATKAVFALGPELPPTPRAVEYARVTRSSDLLETLHSLFHRLAARRIVTRFGLLSDSPRAILSACRGHERDVIHANAMADALPESDP
jgi:hypothetical protein